MSKRKTSDEEIIEILLRIRQYCGPATLEAEISKLSKNGIIKLIAAMLSESSHE